MNESGRGAEPVNLPDRGPRPALETFRKGGSKEKGAVKDDAPVKVANTWLENRNWSNCNEMHM